MRSSRALLLVAAGACLLSGAFLTGCADKPVAFVNGEKITEEEFVEELEREAGPVVLGQMITRRIAEVAAERQGLAPTEADVDAEIARLKQEGFGNDEAMFLTSLRASGMTIDDLRRSIRWALVQRALCEKDLQYSDDDLRGFYNDRKERYDRPERVVIQEIIVLSEDQADEVHKLATEEGADFDALARQYQIAGRPEWRATGGRSRPISREALFPEELRKPVFALDEGGVTKPIRTAGNRLHIIKKLQELPAEKSTFEAARDRVEREYRDSLARPPDEVMAELRRQANVQVLSDRYAAVGEAFRNLGLPEYGQEGAPAMGGSEAAPGGAAAPPADSSAQPDTSGGS